MRSTKNDFRCVEPHVLLIEDSMLGKVVMKIASIHEVQNKTQLVLSVEGVRHAHDEWAVRLKTRSTTFNVD
jgi:hypothetical protein